MSASEVRERLALGAEAAFAFDAATLASVENWLTQATPSQLSQIDRYARGWRWAGPGLGPADRWTPEVLGQPSPVVLVLASMHHDGYLRDRATLLLAAAEHPLADRALALRLPDHVAPVRQAGLGGVWVRTDLDAADRIMSVLLQLAGRLRLADLRERYLDWLCQVHGDAEVWAAFRRSPDRRVRRLAFRHCLSTGLLDVDAAVAALPAARDSVVSRLLVRAIVDGAAPDVIRTLLHGRSADGRVMALVRLDVADLDPADVEPLLADRSTMVRYWARKRWADLGRDPVAACVALATQPGSGSARARAFVGLLEAGGDLDRRQALELVESGDPSLEKIGLAQLGVHGDPDDVPLLFHVLRTGSRRSARLAGAALVRLRRVWNIDDLRDLKASADPEVRWRAWWLRRNLGGWEQIIADLEVIADPDPALAAYGRNVAAPLYLTTPTEAQRARVRELLADANLPPVRRLDIALAAAVR